MPLLKAQQNQRLSDSVIVMDLADLEHEAVAMLEKARKEAVRIVAEARSAGERESVRIREDARQAGQSEGFAAGQAEGRKHGHEEAAAAARQHLAELITRWSKTLDILHQNMPAHIADAKMDLVRLALAIAVRVTRQEAINNRAVAPAVVEETLRLAGAARKVTLHVDPIEADLLEKYLPELLAKVQSIESVDLKRDADVGPGGCVLRFGSGEIDAKLETQLARISDELLGEAGGRP